jgi:predicted TIM-barrel fold metal-dependent hydrolase
MLMDHLGIQKSILSVTAPGSHLDPADDALGTRLASHCNDFMASVAQSHPTRFGFFASLPLPDVDSALVEIDRSMTLPGAHGVGLMSNNHGIYLGDAKFDPVFRRLDALKAKVFLHPNYCRHAYVHGEFQRVPEHLPAVPSSILEYFFDTARTVTNLLHTGTVERYSNITFIVPHCGAVLPAVLERITSFATRSLGMSGIPTSQKVRELLRTRFFFDTAGFVCPEQVAAILALTSPDRLLYGTDLPFLPVKVAEEQSQDLDEYIRKHCGIEWLSRIYQSSAEGLFGSS